MIGWKVNDDDDYKGMNIQALSGIRTHGLSAQAIKAYASNSSHWDRYPLLWRNVGYWRTDIKRSKAVAINNKE
jgi:hypothetical protein